MSETIRVSGKTVEDAITNATISLGVTSDNIVYTVVEHESKGFLGIGQKNAVIEVRVKSEADFEAERLKKKAEEDAARQAKEAADRKRRQEEKEAAEAAKAAEIKKQQEEKAARTAAMAAEEAAKDSSADEASKSESLVERDEEESKDAPVKREREIKVLENPQEAIDKAEEFLRDVYSAMGMEVELISTYDGEVLNVQMNGDDMGILIGKRGQTLDSLQYLTSLVVNKGSSGYVRVKLDTENYRERRKATLENLAKNISVKVKKSRQSVALEPMNPYERRIIHSALQNDPFVTTHSEGVEPDRKVVVTLKADADLEALDRKYGERRRGGRGSYRNSKGGRKGDRRGYRRHDENNYGNEIERIEPVEIPDPSSEGTAEE